MRIDVVTLFPEMFSAITDYGVISRAYQERLFSLEFWNPRDFATDRHRTVDDRPYGGGPGMVLKYEPLRDAIRQARKRLPLDSREFVLSAQGRPFDQALARDLAQGPGLLLVAGRYEGLDERIINNEIEAELSLGDYVLSGGELAAAVVIDAVARLLPDVLGHTDSPQQESYMAGLLDYPQYTRPETVDGSVVPEVLTQGNHEAIRRWRMKQALGRTWLRRPQLLEVRTLTPEERTLLGEFIDEHDEKHITDS